MLNAQRRHTMAPSYARSPSSEMVPAAEQLVRLRLVASRTTLSTEEAGVHLLTGIGNRTIRFETRLALHDT
jgi:hypothetical protein